MGPGQSPSGIDEQPEATPDLPVTATVRPQDDPGGSSETSSTGAAAKASSGGPAGEAIPNVSQLPCVGCVPVEKPTVVSSISQPSESGGSPMTGLSPAPMATGPSTTGSSPPDPPKSTSTTASLTPGPTSSQEPAPVYGPADRTGLQGVNVSLSASTASSSLSSSETAPGSLISGPTSASSTLGISSSAPADAPATISPSTSSSTEGSTIISSAPGDPLSTDPSYTTSRSVDSVVGGESSTPNPVATASIPGAVTSTLVEVPAISSYPTISPPLPTIDTSPTASDSDDSASSPSDNSSNAVATPKVKRFSTEMEYVTLVKIYKRGSNVCNTPPSLASPLTAAQSSTALDQNPAPALTPTNSAVLGPFKSTAENPATGQSAPPPRSYATTMSTLNHPQETPQADTTVEGATILNFFHTPNPAIPSTNTAFSGTESGAPTISSHSAAPSQSVTVTRYNSQGRPISTQVVNTNPTFITFYNSANEPTSTATLNQFATIVDVDRSGNPYSTYTLYDPITTLTEVDQSGHATSTSVGNVPLSTITYYNAFSEPISVVVAVSGQPTTMMTVQTTPALTVQLRTAAPSPSHSVGHRTKPVVVIPMLVWSVFVIPIVWSVVS